MTLVYDNRPATRDINCVFSQTNTNLLNNILDQAQFVFNLPDGWINEEVKGPLESLLKEDKETFKSYSNLKILKGRELLAMKVLAARREPAKDFADAILLCNDLGWALPRERHCWKRFPCTYPCPLLVSGRFSSLSTWGGIWVMIGNKYLREVFHYPDEDMGINQLLEFLRAGDRKFLESLEVSEDLDSCNEQEIAFLTKTAALADYYLQSLDVEVPRWLRDGRLSFERPHYYPKGLSDFEKVKLQYTNPAPFRARNIYFDLDGIRRV